jgi:uncharacterized membrane protein YdbT with pleckstrin-like domain
MADNNKKAEQEIYTITPSMFRNNPIQFLVWLIFMGVGLALIFIDKLSSFLGIMGLILACIGALSLFGWWLKEYNTVLTITNKRTIYQKGIFSKQKIEIFHHNVRNIETKQSFFDRVFGVGSISIASSGQDGYDISVTGIRDSEGVKQKINQFVVDE